MNKISSNWLELSPAYGRDYKTKKEVEAAFKEGKDFLGDYTIGFKPCNIHDFAPGVKVNLRYKKNTEVTVFTVPVEKGGE